MTSSQESVWAGTMGELQEPFGEPLDDTKTSAIVTNIDVESKEVTVELAPEDLPTTEMSALEEASMKFTKLLPFVSKIGRSMNGNGVIRVLHAFAEFPLGKGQPKLLNHSEKQLFHILTELSGYKSTVMIDILKKQNELEKERQTAAELPAVENKEVETNG